MTRILSIAGRKQSGKSTLCNFLHGYQMRCFDIIKDFVVTNEGELFVNAGLGEDGKEEDSFLKLDISRKDQEFNHWAERVMHPVIKRYSFAEELKNLCVELFNIPFECCFGTDEQKNQPQEHLLWEDMPGVIIQPKDDHDQDELWRSLEAAGQVDGITFGEDGGPMTAREFMQFFGTDVMRKIWEPVWIERTIKKINQEQPLLAVIDDMRFCDELLNIKGRWGDLVMCVGLTRKVKEDSHSSENLDPVIDACDLIIDNSTMTINEVNKELISNLDTMGWLGEDMSKSKKTPIHQIRK